MWSSLPSIRESMKKSSGRDPNRGRFFRPRPELLEDRRLLTAGTYFEDFTHDADRILQPPPGWQFRPAWDTFDSDPKTIPLGDADNDPLTTLGPDELLIRNDFPSPTVTNGPTRTGGNAVIVVNPNAPVGPNILALTSGEGQIATMIFDFPNPGDPGGFAADEEVASANIDVRGFGEVTFVGANNSLVFNVSTRDPTSGQLLWTQLSAARDSLVQQGNQFVQLGAIQQIMVRVSSRFDINRLGVLVFPKPTPQTNVIANDDYAIVSQRQQIPVAHIDWRRNDVALDDSLLTLVSHTQAAHGTVSMDNASGTGNYEPVPGFLGRDSFEYTLSDGQGNTDKANVILDVVNNLPPVTTRHEFLLDHGAPLPIRRTLNYTDPDGDPAVAAALAPAPGDSDVAFPRRGFVNFVISNGRVDFEYQPRGGRLGTSDQFYFTVTDAMGGTSEPVLVELVVPNTAPSFAGGIIEAAHGAPTPLRRSFPVHDAEGDLVTPILIDDGSIGTVSRLAIVNGLLEVEYETPSGHAIGRDFFTFRLTDGFDSTNPITIEIVVPNFRPEIVMQPGNLTPVQVGGLSLFTDPGTTPVIAGTSLFSSSSDQGITLLRTLRDADGGERSGPGETLAVDHDGDPLVAVLFDQARYGNVELQPDGRFTYTPLPLPFKVSASGMDDVAAEMHAAFPSRSSFIDEAAARLNDLGGAEFATLQEFLAAATFRLEDAPESLALNPQEVAAFKAKLPSALHQDTFFRTDSFTYRVTDGAELSSDVIYVEIKQSLGQGLARSDMYWMQDTRGTRVLDEITISARSLISNDVFDTGLVASPFAQVLRLHSRLGDFDSEGVTIRIVDTDEAITADNPYIELDEDFTYVTIGNTSDSVRYNTFTYDFLYQPPGLLDSGPLIASTRATVVLAITRDEEADADGVPDDTEHFDGNGDGIDDFEQSSVATLPNAVDGSYVTFEAGTGTTLFGVQATDIPSPSDAPADAQFPIGFFHVSVVGVEVGGAAAVTMYLHSPIHIDSYYKYGEEPTDNPATPDIDEHRSSHWYEFLYDGTTGAQFFDGAGQEVAPHTSAVVSRIVLHFKDSERGDKDPDLGLIGDPGGPVVFRRAPQVQSVVINDGAAQRSKINSLTVAFDGLVTVAPGAFELHRQGSNKPLPIMVAISESDGRTVARLIFTGQHVVGGSLADGTYRLVIRGDKVRDAAGRLLDGDGDGDEGGSRVDEFFRRFGDTDGDDDVDGLDAQVFGSTFGKRSHQSGYLWYLDFNANGRIWAEDLALFLLGYIRSTLRRG